MAVRRNTRPRDTARPRGRRRATLAAITAGLLLLTLSPTGATGPSTAAADPAPRGAEAAPSAGAAGIGDPYYPKDGNSGYDVVHYDVHVERYQPATTALRGWTEITARATQPLSRFNLDLLLDVDAVLVDGAPAREFAKADSAEHELVVTPQTPIPAGAEFTVRVDYHGVPKSLRYRGSRSWLASDVETMATNEPHIAPWWFPANDHPRDKATFSIAVTVPSGNQAVSNGVLVGSEDDGSWSTWRWRVDEPMATYLAFFAAGRFRLDSGVADGRPYLNAVSRQLPAEQQDKAMRLMRRHVDIVRWFEGLLGAYPFAATGGVTTSLFTGFALENQTRPTYPFLGNGPYARSIVVHEVSHQWFGNYVSVDRWRDIWVNEGLATWWQWRYDEAHGGPPAQQVLRTRYSGYLRSDSFWRLTIADPGPRRLFAYPVYERGAMAVQALRHRIGNRDFMRLLRRWLDERADGTGRVGQFQRLAETVSGERLDGFFRAWLRVGEKPARTRANGLRR